MDVSLGLDLVIIREAVHFVDKHFKVDVWIDSVGPWNGEVEPAQGLHIIILRERKQHISGHLSDVPYWEMWRLKQAISTLEKIRTSSNLKSIF